MPILAGSQVTGATLGVLIEETKRHLLSGQRPSLNRLAADVAPTATNLTFQFDISQIQPGTQLELDMELVHVWSTEPASRTVTVERAQSGSRVSAHPAGTVATLNPKFPDFAIAKAINDDLSDLCSPFHGLYSVRALELRGTANSRGYDLPGADDMTSIMDVRIKHAGQPREWSTVVDYSLDRSVDLREFPSGLALTLSGGVWQGASIRVLYKTGFSPLTLRSDSAEQVAGLPVSMHDLPPLGAAIRLVAPREIRRNFVEEQGDTRRAEEVPPGAIGGSTRPLQIARQSRIVAEAAKLAQLYPDRGFIPPPTYAGGFW